MKALLLLGVLQACPVCPCPSFLQKRHESFLQKRQVPTLGQGTVDPLATEAIASRPSATSAPGSAVVEMVSTDPMLLRAAHNRTELQEIIASRLSTILDVPASRFVVVPANDGSPAPGSPAAAAAAAAANGTGANATANGTANATVLLQLSGDPVGVALRMGWGDPDADFAEVKAAVDSGNFGRAEVPVNDGTSTDGMANDAALLQMSNVSAVMWVLQITPLPAPPVPNADGTNATNATSVDVVVCPPCPCMDAAGAVPGAPPDVPGLTPPAGPSAEALAAELVLEAHQPGSRLAAVFPLTNVRQPGGHFASIARTSVAIGSRPMKDGMTLQEAKSVEAMRINEHTLQTIQHLKQQLQKANEQRAYILTHGMEAPSVDGLLPLPVQDTDPWSSMKDDSLLGRHEAR